MSQGILDTVKMLAWETETIRRSQTMDQMRIERLVTTGFRGLCVPARTGCILFHIGRKCAVGFRDFCAEKSGPTRGLIGDEIWGTGEGKHKVYSAIATKKQ